MAGPTITEARTAAMKIVERRIIGGFPFILMDVVDGTQESVHPCRSKGEAAGMGPESENAQCGQIESAAPLTAGHRAGNGRRLPAIERGRVYSPLKSLLCLLTGQAAASLVVPSGGTKRARNILMVCQWAGAM